VSEEITTKEDVSPSSVAALAASARLDIAPDRIEVIAQRLRELFDLAAPLEGSDCDEFEVTQPFDPRWTNEVSS
jgi:Asp-tRNA(Asn)/Glu-tRNA(Gln) amidotransferase C subunit